MATDLHPPSAPPAPARNRAGRNLPAATAVGVAMGAAVLATLYGSPPAFLALVVVAILIGGWELVRALRAGGHHAPYPPVAAGSAGILTVGYVYGREMMVLAVLLAALAVVVWRLAEGPQALLPDLAAGVLALVYVGGLAGFAALMLAAPDGDRRITAFVATVVASDVGGYAAGVVRGRHPMAPTVSPKKSWEGFAGSLAVCAGIGGWLVTWLCHGLWWQGVVFGLTIAVSATAGDLGESMLKRDLGIKDMGHLLPGHGGLMDRLDSLLPSAPVAWGLLALFATR